LYPGPDPVRGGAAGDRIGQELLDCLLIQSLIVAQKKA
jgi:hypothetical protein